MEIEAHLDDNIAEDTLKTNNHSLYAPDTMEAEEQVFPRMEKNMEDRGKKSQFKAELDETTSNVLTPKGVT